MPAIDWSMSSSWDFEPLDNERFPAVELAKRCGELGTAVTAMYNAANEEAVASFIAGKIEFLGIVDLLERVVQKLGGGAISQVRNLDDVSAIENDARTLARELMGV